MFKRRASRFGIGVVFLAVSSLAKATSIVYVYNDDWILAAADKYAMQNGQPLAVEVEKVHPFGERGFLVEHGEASFEARSGKRYAFSQLIREFKEAAGVSQAVIKDSQCGSLSGLSYDRSAQADDNAVRLVKAINACWTSPTSTTFDVLSFERKRRNAPYQVIACTIDLSSGNQAKAVRIQPPLGSLKNSPSPAKLQRHQVIVSAATDHLIYRALHGLDKNLRTPATATRHLTGADRAFLYAAEEYRDSINFPSNKSAATVLPGLMLDLEFSPLTLGEAASIACRLVRFQLEMEEHNTRTHWGRLLDQGYERVTWPLAVTHQIHWGYVRVGTGGAVSKPLVWNQARTDSCLAFASKLPAPGPQSPR